MQARQPGPAHTQTQRQKEISRKTDTERNGTSYCKRDLQKQEIFKSDYKRKNFF
jgi:hypothetical protein